MSQMLVVEGRVLGGHMLEDLKVSVPYKGQVPLPLLKAKHSEDLREALRLGQVVKIKVYSQPTSPRQIARPTQPKPHARPTPISTSNASSETPTEALVARKENVELKAHNKALLAQQEALIAQHARMLEAQETLLTQLGELLKQPRVSQVSASTGAPVVSASLEDDPEDVVPHFIPSVIHNKDVKVQGDQEIKATTKTGKSTDTAAKALAALKKPSRRRRKKPSSD
jgi:hypothetical protein